ncbi:MAG: amidohydrolase family protein [Gemmatimonadota bacterium]
MSEPRPTRYLARWVVPVSAEPIADGALLVDAAGRIAAVGPAATVPAPPDAAEVDLGEAALLPGLVNTHAHPELVALRGLLEDLPFHSWIPLLRRAKVAAELDAEDFAAGALWTCVEAVAAGITTLGATEDSGAALGALRTAGLRGVVYREVFGPDPAQAEGAVAQLRERVLAMRALETDLVRVGVSPHAPYTVSDQLFSATARLALEEELPLAVHTAEAQVEEELVVRAAGPFAAGLRARGITVQPRAHSTAALLHRLGVLRARPLLIHCVRVHPDDGRRLADAGATVAHCPVANARLGHGTAPVPELLEAGVRVGLGTDSMAANNRMDILEEARTAQLVQRTRLRHAGVFPAADVLRMATLGGAEALGLAERTGSLEAGKDADLCAVALEAPHTRPVHDVAAAVVHAARGSDVVLTVVRGRVLYEGRNWLTLDPPAILPRVEDSARRLHRAVLAALAGTPAAVPAAERR